MTTTINASTSSGLVVTPDNSGNVVLQYNGVSTPTFSAYTTAATACLNNQFTKVQYNGEEWDTASCYDAATSTFTPTVAGYYQFTACLSGLSSMGTNAPIVIAKNTTWRLTGINVNGYAIVSGVMYANGTTDYFEVYQYNTSGATVNTAANSTSNFSACLLRGA